MTKMSKTERDEDELYQAMLRVTEAKAESTHLRVEIARLTKERDAARAEIADSKLENGYVIGWNSGWDEAFQRLKFPTMLRKMWSGGDVQRWLDERREEQTGPIPGSLSERMFAADARVAELEGALVSIQEYWNGSRTDGAMSDALDYITETARAALGRAAT